MAEPKIEVVISGIGGLFPESNNLDEFKELLFNKVNAVTSDSRRWMPGMLGTPHGIGKIKNPEKFDSMFFGIHTKMAESLDALTKLSLERSIEAIVDAGLNPNDLSGTNTGVFMNSCVSESEFFEVFDTHQKGFGLLGHNRAMQANRLSYTLNLNGPSYTTDSTWVGGVQALMRAKRMIEDGVINAAIIGSCNLCMNPNISLQYEGLGRLSKTTETKSFSEDANGMNRAEACVAVLLQKSTDAKRSYGTLLNVTSIFGETNNLFYHYSDHLYKNVLCNAYKEAGVDPAEVAYIEGEGLGIKKIDAMELNVLSEVFCTSNRITPLNIGSVKSNIGHCEASSSLASLAKALIILDTGYIPPNINYSEPNSDVPALFSGKLEIVTEKTPLSGDIIGISSFGLCNSISHIILKQNKKRKTKIYEKGEMFNDGLPRLIFISGRNEKCVKQSIERIKNIQMDEEYASLLQNVFYKPLNAHYYRSYSIIPDKDEVTQEEIIYLPTLVKRPIWFIFSGMGSQWNSMGKQLLNIPIFAKSINKCEVLLKPKGVDLIEILTSEDPTIFNNILNSFVGIAAIQIGLVDVLKSIDIFPDGIIGHSVGELGCAYADGCFTAEQMILAAHARGRASIETELIDGMMAAIGLGYNDIKDRLPHDIEVACHNSSDSSTLSGPTASVTSFVEQLKSEGIFAKVVNVSNIAYHSRYIKPAAPILLKYLKEVIPESKPRSSKWVSSSIPQSEWNNELAQTSSPEYHTNNLLGQVLFEEASRHIPEDAIVIEIAPHGLLQAILKRSLSEKVTNIPLTNKNKKDSVKFLLRAFGKMYVNGMTPNIEAFYPLINYPVSRGTQSLNSISIWDHEENWTLKGMVLGSQRVPGESRFTISLNNESVLMDYKINGHHIIPTSFFLLHVWKYFMITKNELNFKEIVEFQDLYFLKNIEITENDTFEFYLFIQSGSGHFEVCLDNDVIISGRIHQPDAIDMITMNPKMKFPNAVSDTPYSSISKYDLYTLFEQNGYQLGENIKTVTNIDLYFEEYRGNIKWKNDWMNFFNSIFSFLIHKSMENNDNPAAISTIRKLCIDPSKFQNFKDQDIAIYYNFNTNEIKADGLYILHPEIKPFSINILDPFELELREEQFIQFNNPQSKDEISFINNCFQIIFESKNYQLNHKLNKYILYYNNNDQTMSQYIELIKQILDHQIGIQYTISSLDKVNPENFTSKENNIVLVSKVQMENIFSLFQHAYKANLLVLSNEPLKNHKEWRVIMQQKFNDHNIVLIKKIIKNEISVLQIENIAHLRNFYEDIKTSLVECKKTKRYLYVFTKIIPYTKLTRFIEEVFQRNKSKLIKFIFIVDKSCTNINIKNEFFTEQLRNHLFMNIYKDGKWGTIVRNIVDNSNMNISNNYPSYIDSIKLHGLEVKYFGINFPDITVNNITDSQLGILEYSGLSTDGKMIMGIAPFENNTLQEILPDPYLSWIIPSDWSLEDAATVPLSYSMVYYILTVLISPEDILFDKTILIHAGLSVIGQAAITIALAEEFTVYATVENEEQTILLKKKFPSLLESRIFLYKKNDFEIKLKMSTNGKGIPIILNCLNGNEFYASLRILSNRGKFFQLSKTDMKKKNKLGLIFFLKIVGFHSVSPVSMLAENSEIKLKIKNHVQKAIELGIVKPFERYVLTGPCTEDQAIKALNYTSHRQVVVVLSLEREKLTENVLKNSSCVKYQCCTNSVYLIVGSKYSIWIDIAEWLVTRGARKIIVSIEKYAMSTTTSRRFNLLMSRYQNIIIQIVSDSNLNSKESLIQLINDTTTAITPLAGVFFATLTEETTKIRNVQNALEHFKSLKPLFVCIMSGGDEICMELRANRTCPNAISISWSSLTIKPKFSNIIQSLDKLLKNLHNISSSTIICTEYNNFYTNRDYHSKMVSELPESIDELKSLGDTITDEPEFVEVFTNSPRYADTVGGLPIFVVSGFRPEKLNKLYANLIYPTFEARLPETIESIEFVATKLVQKLKMISKCGNVSLIGISWGGAVCIIMAQMLETENIGVSLTLLEGLPNAIQEWTNSLTQYGNINARLVLNYFNINSTVAKTLATEAGWNTELPMVLKLNNVSNVDKILSALNAIRSRLNTIFTLKSLSNRLNAKVMVINRNISNENTSIQNLLNYCVNLPGVYKLDETNYDKMLSQKEVAKIINKNILHYHPNAKDILITELYTRNEVNIIGLSLS